MLAVTKRCPHSGHVHSSSSKDRSVTVPPYVLAYGYAVQPRATMAAWLNCKLAPKNVPMQPA